ncbi:MAG: hypothetical protein GX625_18375 [Clostridiaceae bacterium]|nr:hypothetical protein [Clostridiaceae bacterium]
MILESIFRCPPNPYKITIMKALRHYAKNASACSLKFPLPPVCDSQISARNPSNPGRELGRAHIPSAVGSRPSPDIHLQGSRIHDSEENNGKMVGDATLDQIRPSISSRGVPWPVVNPPDEGVYCHLRRGRATGKDLFTVIRSPGRSGPLRTDLLLIGTGVGFGPELATPSPDPEIQ